MYHFFLKVLYWKAFHFDNIVLLKKRMIELKPILQSIFAEALCVWWSSLSESKRITSKAKSIIAIVLFHGTIFYGEFVAYPPLLAILDTKCFLIFVRLPKALEGMWWMQVGVKEFFSTPCLTNPQLPSHVIRNV